MIVRGAGFHLPARLLPCPINRGRGTGGGCPRYRKTRGSTCGAIAGRRFGAGVRRVGRGLVRRRRRDQADRRPAVHPAPDDGHHGPPAQGGRLAPPRRETPGGGRTASCRTAGDHHPDRSPRRSPVVRTPWRWPRPADAGPLRWSLDGTLPEGLSFDPASGDLRARRRRARPSRSHSPCGSATGPTSRPVRRGCSSIRATSR